MKKTRARKRVSSASRQISQLKVELVNFRHEIDWIRGFVSGIQNQFNSVDDRIKKLEHIPAQLAEVVEKFIKEIKLLESESHSLIRAAKQEAAQSDDRVEYLVLTLDKELQDLKSELMDFFTERLIQDAEAERKRRVIFALQHIDVKQLAGQQQDMTFQPDAFKLEDMRLDKGEIGHENKEKA